MLENTPQISIRKDKKIQLQCQLLGIGKNEKIVSENELKMKAFIKQIFTLLLTTIFVSCTGPFANESSAESIKLNKTDDFHLKIISPDTIGQEKFVMIKIHIDNSKYKLKQAYYGCKIITPPNNRYFDLLY